MKYRDPVTGNLELFPILNIANKKEESGGGGNKDTIVTCIANQNNCCGFINYIEIEKE